MMSKKMTKAASVRNIFFALFSPVFVQAQAAEPVNLQWKIGKNEKIVYLTNLQPLDSSTVSFAPDIFSKIIGEDRTALMDTFFHKLKEELSDVTMITELQMKGSNIVDIVAYAKPSSDKASDSEQSEGKLLDLFKDLMQGVLLRGSVFKNGGIHSFWVMDRQKNLISMFFEMPRKPVSIGDSWPLDISLIANDQHFECDSSSKINRVTLTELKKVGNETIATLKYEISEFVQGTFHAPSFTDKSGKEPTTLHFTFDGLAEFSIEKGRWKTYSGVLSLISSGFMKSNQKTFCSLTEKK